MYEIRISSLNSTLYGRTLPVRPLFVLSCNCQKLMSSHNLPHASDPAPVIQNFTAPGAKIQQTNQFTGVSPGTFILDRSFDQQIGTTKEELAFEMRQNILLRRRRHGSEVRHGQVHSVKNLRTNAGSSSFSHLNVWQPVQTWQIQDIELYIAFIFKLDLNSYQLIYHTETLFR